VSALIILTLAVVGWMLLITGAARDMDARGRDGRIYGLLMLVPPLGIVVWLVKRSQYPRLAGGRS
jgi:hypothetical protein